MFRTSPPVFPGLSLFLFPSFWWKCLSLFFCLFLSLCQFLPIFCFFPFLCDSDCLFLYFLSHLNILSLSGFYVCVSVSLFDYDQQSLKWLSHPPTHPSTRQSTIPFIHPSRQLLFYIFLYIIINCMGWRIPSLSKSHFLSHQLSHLTTVPHIHLAMATKSPQLIKASFTKYWANLASHSTCVVVLTLWVRSIQCPEHLWFNKLDTIVSAFILTQINLLLIKMFFF